MLSVSVKKSNRTLGGGDVIRGQCNDARYLNSPLPPLSFIRRKKRACKLNQSFQVTIEEDSDSTINSPVDLNNTVDIEDKSSDNDSTKDVFSCKYTLDCTSMDYSCGESVNRFSVDEAPSLAEMSLIRTSWRIDSMISEPIRCRDDPLQVKNSNSPQLSSPQMKLKSKAFKKQSIRLSSENVELEFSEELKSTKSLLSQIISDYEPNLSSICNSNLNNSCSDDVLLLKTKRKKKIYSKTSNLCRPVDYADPEESLDPRIQKVCLPIDECSPEKKQTNSGLPRICNSQGTKTRYARGSKVLLKPQSQCYPDDSPDISSVKVDYPIDIETPKKQCSNSGTLEDKRSHFKLKVASCKVKRKLADLAGDSDESSDEIPKKVCVPIVNFTPKKVQVRKNLPITDLDEDSDDLICVQNSSITISVKSPIKIPTKSSFQKTILSVQKPNSCHKMSKFKSYIDCSKEENKSFSQAAPRSRIKTKTACLLKKQKPILDSKTTFEIVTSPDKDYAEIKTIHCDKTPEKSSLVSAVRRQLLLNRLSTDEPTKIKPIEFKKFSDVEYSGNVNMAGSKCNDKPNQLLFQSTCSSSGNNSLEDAHAVKDLVLLCEDSTSHQNSFNIAVFNSPNKEDCTSKGRLSRPEKDKDEIVFTPDKKEACIMEVVIDMTPQKSSEQSFMMKKKLSLKRNPVKTTLGSSSENRQAFCHIDIDSEPFDEAVGADNNESAFKLIQETPTKKDEIKIYSQGESPRQPPGFDISTFHSPDKEGLSVREVVSDAQIPGLTPFKSEPPKVENLVFISKNKRKILKNGSLVGRALNVINAYRVSKKLLNYELEVGLKSKESFFMSNEMLVLRTWSRDNIGYIKCKQINSECEGTVVFLVSELPVVQNGSKIVASFPLKVFTSNCPLKVLAMTDRIEVSGSVSIPPPSSTETFSSSSYISDIFNTDFSQNSITYSYLTDFSVKSIQEAAMLCHFTSSISLAFKLIKHEIKDWGCKSVLFDGTSFCLLNIYSKNFVNFNICLDKTMIYENVSLLGKINVQNDNLLSSLNCINPKVKWVFHFACNQIKLDGCTNS